MRHRDPRDLCLPERELLQLTKTNERLCKLNRAALRDLRRIGYSNLTAKQYGEAGESLTLITIQINSALLFREQIITGARGGPELLQLIVGSYCGSCGEKSRLLIQHNDHQAELPEPLKQDPAWQTEVDCLLELVHRTEERVFARHRWRGTVQRSFFTALNRLTNALVRQKRHLQALAPKQMVKMEVREEFKTCIVCGNTLDLPDEKKYQIEYDDQVMQ